MTQRMQAWQVTGPGEPADVLHLVEVDLPEPGPGQARIRVTAAGICNLPVRAHSSNEGISDAKWSDTPMISTSLLITFS